MSSSSQISIKTLQADLYKTFKEWHKTTLSESSLWYLALFQKFRREGYSISKATNHVILTGLEALEKDNPKHATFLYKRFIDEQSVYQVANHFNVSESYAYNIQKKAIRNLAEKLLSIEEANMESHHEALETRLEPSTYLSLIGVDEHLKKLTQVLVEPNLPWVVSIEGIGGIGKTSLADALVRDMIRKGLFEDLAWVSAPRNIFNLGGSINPSNRPALTVDGLVETLVMELLNFTPAQLSGKQAFNALHNCLKERSHLIVIDNLETVLDVSSLLPTLRRLTNPTKFLLTSRESLYGEPDVYHFVVPALTEPNALRLVRKEAKVRNLSHLVEAEDEGLRAIYETVGGNPLALRLVVGQTHIHPLSVILDDLNAARGQKAESLYTYIYRRAWDTLDEVTQTAFAFMPLALEHGSELDFLQTISELEPHQLRHALDVLVTLNLVDLRGMLGERRYSIHNLTRTFLQKQVVKWQSHQ